jgi:ribonuclease P protein component
MVSWFAWRLVVAAPSFVPVGPRAVTAWPSEIKGTTGFNAVGAERFPRQYRLTKTDEFSSVFGFRKAIKSRYFLLHYRFRADREAPGARLGLIVAKRLLPRAVDRNLVRRLARESFRKSRTRLPSRDLILRLGARPEKLDRQALTEEIQGLLDRMISAER